VAAALGLWCSASGCLIDARLYADASGKLTIRYRLDGHATLAAVAERLASPSVTVRSGRIDEQGYGTFKLVLADAQTLSSVAMFKNVSVRQSPGANPGTTAFVATFAPAKPIQLTEELRQRFGNEFKLVVTFPGAVVESNATTRDGATATWIVPLQTLLSDSQTSFSATYRKSSAPGAAG
jgi:hypothetical protein